MTNKETIFLIKNKYDEAYWTYDYLLENHKDGFYLKFEIKTKSGSIQKFLLPKENLSVIIEQEVERVVQSENIK